MEKNTKNFIFLSRSGQNAYKLQFTFMTNTAKKQTSLPTDIHTMQQALPLSKLVFYAQSTSAVISGRAGTAKWCKTLYILKIKYIWNTMYSP